MIQIYPLLLLCVAALLLESEARIGVTSKKIASTEEDRELGNYGYGNGNGNNYGYGYNRNQGNNQANSNGNNNNYYNNYNNYNNYRRYRYYGNGQGGNGSDVNNDDQVEDDQVEIYDDDADTTDNTTNYQNTTTWRGYISSVESEMEQNFYNWYESPPGQWTTAQWAWFSGLLTLALGLFVCIFMCCSSCCKDEKERNRSESTYDFDDYTSMDSRKGSFMTKDSGDSTEFDDNATYDSIMRLRSD